MLDVAYPVTFDVEEQIAGRNRLTTAFRAILAIPHVLIVGSPGSEAWVQTPALASLAQSSR